MRLQKVQDALNKKNIKFEYTEEDGCGSLDFMFRGLKFHVWEYEDNGWGAETNISVRTAGWAAHRIPLSMGNGI